MNVFEVAISPDAGGGKFRVDVLSSPDGSLATAVTELDVPGLAARHYDLEDAVLLSAGLAAAAGPARERAGHEDRIRAAGRELFTALLGTGEVAGRYRAAAAVAADRGEGLRVVLRIGDPALAALPWEAMYDEGAGRYVCRREQLVRHVGVPVAVPSLAVKPPLRVLGIVSAPHDLPPLDVEREQRQLERALSRLTADGTVALSWARSATWADLQDELQSGTWHVVHYVGHGFFDADLGEGVLALTGEDGQADMVEASRFIDLIGSAWPMPRLIVLNSCSGAAGSAEDLFAGTAAALVRGGAGAVVAMQYEISDGAALAFSRGFYGAIARGRGVDEAVTSGRTAILGSARTLEWVTPVLYLRGAESRLFTVSREEPPAPAPVPAPSRVPTAGRAPVRLARPVGRAAGARGPAAQPELPRRASRTIETLAGSAGRLSFSPDGLLLASAHPHGAVRVWETQTGDGVASWTHQDIQVDSIAYSPLGGAIASGWSDGRVRLLDVAAARPPETPAPPDPEPERPFTETETDRLRDEIARIHSTQDSALTLLRSVKYPPSLVPAWPGNALGFWAMVFSDIENGAMPDPDPFRRILRAALRAYPGNRELKALADGPRPATAAPTVRGERVVLQHAGPGPVTVAFSPDGGRLASAGGQWLVLVSGLPGAHVDRRHEVADVRSLAFSPDGSLLAAGRGRGEVRFISVDGATRGRLPAEHGAAVTGLEFHPDRGLLAAVVADGPARLQDLASDRFDPLGHGAARAAAFSPDGRLLAVAAGREVVFWGTAPMTRAGLVHAFTADVLDVAFAQGTGVLAVACADGTIQLLE